MTLYNVINVTFTYTGVSTVARPCHTMFGYIYIFVLDTMYEDNLSVYHKYHIKQ